MGNLKKIAKTIAICGAVGVLGLGLSGCATQGISLEDHNKALSEAKAKAYDEGKDSVDITSNDADVRQNAIDELAAAEPIEEEIVSEVVGEAMLWDHDYFLGDSIDITLGDNKITKLMDDVITVDGDTHDVAEYIIFDDGAMMVGSSDDKDMEDKPHLIMDEKGALRYEFRFEDPLDAKLLDDDKAEIMFLGKPMKITNIGEDSITVETGAEHYFDVGATFEGVTLENVGANGAVVVRVGDVRTTVSAGKSKNINGMEIKNVETFYADGIEERSATLLIASDVEMEIDNDEYYDDDELWRYNLRIVDDKLESISLELDKKFYDLDRDEKPLAEGETLSLPENYLTIKFVGTNNPDMVDYSFDRDGNCIEIRSGDSEGFVMGTNEYRSVYLDVVEGMFYDDDCGEVELDDELKMKDGYMLTSSLEIMNGDDMLLDVNDLPNRDESLLTDFGIVVDNPEEWDEEGELSISVPEEQLETTIGIY